ncbi:MAG: hypothetical protein FWG56_02225 [Desulfovibrionaceae bacterium]|nr:hypothetical protein [Desulfovibrionaceae bacterium]
MTDVTLNAEQELYVLHQSDGYSSFGFANARERTDQIAGRLGRPDLTFGEQDFGALSGYEKYLAAVHAWQESPLSRQTYFAPATDPKAARVLERCRRDGAKVRLILGDTATGQGWLDEYDVVGLIGRSTGPLKEPLLIEPGASHGGAILTACLLAIIEWASGKFLFRHPKYRAPDLLIRRGENEERPWEAIHGEQVLARFADIGKAGAYVAFMRGETIEPRIFQ